MPYHANLVQDTELPPGLREPQSSKEEDAKDSEDEGRDDKDGDYAPLAAH